MEKIKFNSDVFNLPDCPKDISIAVLVKSGEMLYGRFLSASPAEVISANNIKKGMWVGRKQLNKLSLSPWVLSRFEIEPSCFADWPDGCIIRKPNKQE